MPTMLFFLELSPDSTLSLPSGTDRDALKLPLINSTFQNICCLSFSAISFRFLAPANAVAEIICLFVAAVVIAKPSCCLAILLLSHQICST